ncbi:MAG: hypothetical protein AAGF11_28050 [Myxococcota bacterium]
MSEDAVRLSALLLTEDGGVSADETLRVFMVKLLGHLAPGAVTRDDTRWWEPASVEARDVVRADGWKDPRRVDRVRFLQYVAAKLRQTHGFVFFHVDGDRVYRRRAESENLHKFEALIRAGVRTILKAPPARRRGRRRSSVEEVDAEQLLAKLVLLMPFYSIEAWLFQNTEVATRLCPGPPRCRRGCAKKLARWRLDRGALDEISKPKEELCFGARHNVALAGAGFPLDEILRANKSLRDAVEDLEACASLVRTLEQMMPSWQR